MARRTESEIDRVIAPVVAEYADEDRHAAEEEAREQAASSVFSVRLSPATYRAVQEAAARAHLTPSALIRQWVTERVDESRGGDLASAVASLRRDIERLAGLVPPS